MEARHQHQRRAENHRRIQHHIQAVDVIERQKAEDLVGGIQRGPIRSDELINVGDEIGVGEHHSFGQAGGAAGVGKRGEGLVGGMAGSGNEPLNCS